MRSMNRRDIFPAFGAALLGGIATASLAHPESLSTAPSDDTRLIAHCRKFIGLQKRLDDLLGSALTLEEEAAIEPALDALWEQERAVFRDVVTTRAHTAAGRAAKVEAMLSHVRGSIEDVEGAYWHERMLNSLMRDSLS